jgi:hypothetical protein
VGVVRHRLLMSEETEDWPSLSSSHHALFYLLVSSQKFRSEKTANALSSKTTFCQLRLETVTFFKFPRSLTKIQSPNIRSILFINQDDLQSFIVHQILYLPYQRSMRESSASIQDHREGSPAGAIRSSVEYFLLGSTPGETRSFVDDSSSLRLHDEKETSSPLKVERTRGVGRSRSMIAKIRGVQGKLSHQRKGSEGDISCLTFASSIDSLPRAGSSRRCSLDNLNPPPDSPPSPPRRQMSRRSIFFCSCAPL